MHGKLKIKLRDIVGDIKSGMSDSELMEKYRLSAKGLNRVFQKLIGTGVIDAADIAKRNLGYQDTAFIEGSRETDRRGVVIPLPVYDSSDTEVKGFLKDISETGLRIEGIKAKEGDLRTLQVLAGVFESVQSFVLDVQCRWFRPDESVYGGCLAGFRIVRITEDAHRELLKLIEVLSFTSE